jgi:ribose transport system permease protein
LGTLLGTFIISVLSNGMNIMGLSPEIQQIAKGIVLTVAVFATIDRSKIAIIK